MFDAGGKNDTTATVYPATADGDKGAVGTSTGVTLFDAADAGPVPAIFVAVTVNVTAVPLTRPVTVIGLDAPEAV